MIERPGQRIPAAAFRARRFPASPRHPIRIKRGPELPAGVLPTPPIPTDSAAAPRLPLRAPRELAAAPVDPEYERKLEALAEAMLGLHGEQAANPDSRDDAKAPAIPAKLHESGPVPAGASPAPPWPDNRDHSSRRDVAARVAPDVAARRARQQRQPIRPEPAIDPVAAEPVLRDTGPPLAGRRDRVEARESSRRLAGRRDRIEPELGNADRELAGDRVAPESALREFADRSERRYDPAPSLTSGRQPSARRRPPPATRESSIGAGSIAMTLVAGLAIGIGTAILLSEPDQANTSTAVVAATSGGSVSDGKTAAMSPQHGSAMKDGVVPVIVTPGSNSAADPESGSTSDSASNTRSHTGSTEPASSNSETSSRQSEAADGSGPSPVAKSRAAAKSDASSSAAKPESSKRKADKSGASGSARKSAPRVAAAPSRDDEIGRLKSQAYAESSRDRTRRGAPPASKRPAGDGVQPISTDGGSGASTASVRKRLERCEDAPGLIRRELCKWDVCANQWGKNGCPSYPKGETLY